MKKKIFMALLLSLVLVMTVNAFAEGITRPFFEGFYKQEARDKWVETSGSWSIEDGAYVQSLMDEWAYRSTIKAGTFKNFSMEYKFKLLDGPGWAGVLLRKQNIEDHHDNSGVLFLMNKSVCALYRNGKGEFATTPVQYLEEGYNKVKIVCKNGNIKVYINGNKKPVIDQNDDTYQEGYISLVAGAVKVAFDDVKISPLK